jgi:hypothetical protein
MKPEYKKVLDNILDTFTGSDGGVKFLQFKLMLDALSKQEDEGDLSARAILGIMIQFSKLIDVSGDPRSFK